MLLDKPLVPQTANTILYYFILKGFDIMANEKKLTLTQQFEDILSIPEVANNPKRKAFIEGRIAQIAKKNASGGNGEKKLTATQEANLVLKNDIYNVMIKDVKYTVTDLIKQVPSLNGLMSQKVTALVNQMVTANLLEKVKEKNRTLFIKIVPEAEEGEEA